ncbi:hypothetical protein AXG93_3896s1060 [Marchantia polymorpha subsp. ruderalis]|uniref:Protein kinase domain-containing protein n=1 Tax=Marchantia polymorpha subsp. ruderalis TaxID=1480154 RepID=A0A176WLJ1_MARPO|nr:hypothetical protein AXG93_3896s1060 [Marchantia polymorpha subsp. ruderalis]
MRRGDLEYALFKSRQSLSWKDRIDVISGICEALCYLHERRILHLQVKASNILLDGVSVAEQGHFVTKAKLNDFRLAEALEPGDKIPKESLAYWLSVHKSFGNLPPEAVKEGKFSDESDVYAFGNVILQIVTGKRTADPVPNSSTFLLCNWVEEKRDRPQTIDYLSTPNSVTLSGKMRPLHFSNLVWNAWSRIDIRDPPCCALRSIWSLLGCTLAVVAVIEELKLHDDSACSWLIATLAAVLYNVASGGYKSQCLTCLRGRCLPVAGLRLWPNTIDLVNDYEWLFIKGSGGLGCHVLATLDFTLGTLESPLQCNARGKLWCEGNASDSSGETLHWTPCLRKQSSEFYYNTMGMAVFSLPVRMVDAKGRWLSFGTHFRFEIESPVEYTRREDFAFVMLSRQRAISKVSRDAREADNDLLVAEPSMLGSTTMPFQS